MTTTGPSLPSSITQTTSPTLDTWSNVTRMGTADSSDATVDLTNNGESQTVTLKSFAEFAAIPDSDQIYGITAEINRHSPAATTRDWVLRLLKAGSPVGDSKASASSWPTSATTATYGGPSDHWGIALTGADLKDPDFGITFRVIDSSNTETAAAVDFIQLTATHGPATSLPTRRTLTGAGG